MNQGPLVSILIPLYNAEKYIAETIKSALAQTWRNREIIVVDDGSTDASLVIAKSFEKEGVKVVAKENSGATATRNYAFKLSQGKFIQYLDADDLMAPDKIEAQLKYVSFDETSVVSGRFVRFARSIDNCFGGIGPHENISKDLFPVDWLVQNHTMQTCAWLTPRRLVEQVGGWNESLKQNPNDDGEFWFRVVGESDCKMVRYCKDALIFWRTELPGLALLRTEQACKSLLGTCHVLRRVLLRLEDSPRTRLAAANYYMKFAQTIYPKYPKLTKEAEHNVRELGGSRLPVQGSNLSRSLTKIFGWKMAAWVRCIKRKLWNRKQEGSK